LFFKTLLRNGVTHAVRYRSTHRTDVNVPYLVCSGGDLFVPFYQGSGPEGLHPIERNLTYGSVTCQGCRAAMAETCRQAASKEPPYSDERRNWGRQTEEWAGPEDKVKDRATKRRGRGTGAKHNQNDTPDRITTIRLDYDDQGAIDAQEAPDPSWCALFGAPYQPGVGWGLTIPPTIQQFHIIYKWLRQYNPNVVCFQSGKTRSEFVRAGQHGTGAGCTIDVRQEQYGTGWCVHVTRGTDQWEMTSIDKRGFYDDDLVIDRPALINEVARLVLRLNPDATPSPTVGIYLEALQCRR